MRPRVVAMGIGLSLLLLLGLGGAPPASAGDTWCYTDPAVVITTPAGNPVLVYVTNGAYGLEHLTSLETAQITYQAEPAHPNRSGTDIMMQVTVPNDLFGSGYPASSTVSSGPLATGTVYATATGSAGSPMTLFFHLDVP